jgi:group I intron endonuclease
MEAYIYKITSPTNKIYVGQTINLKSRINRYKNLGCKKQKFLFNSLTKYGWNNHKFEIIKTVDVNFVNFWEIYFIRELNSFYFFNENGMNLTQGGEGTVGHKHSEETKLKMRNSKIDIDEISKSVNQFSLEGVFIKKWENRFVAERFFSIKSDSIKRCLFGDSLTAYKFIWSYNEEVKPINPDFERVRKSCKTVYQYDFNYNLINEFISTSEAAKRTKIEIKNIQAVCLKKRKIAGGYFWSYIKL